MNGIYVKGEFVTDGMTESTLILLTNFKILGYLLLYSSWRKKDKYYIKLSLILLFMYFKKDDKPSRCQYKLKMNFKMIHNQAALVIRTKLTKNEDFINIIPFYCCSVYRNFNLFFKLFFVEMCCFHWSLHSISNYANFRIKGVSVLCFCYNKSVSSTMI